MNRIENFRSKLNRLLSPTLKSQKENAKIRANLIKALWN